MRRLPDPIEKIKELERKLEQLQVDVSRIHRSNFVINTPADLTAPTSGFTVETQVIQATMFVPADGTQLLVMADIYYQSTVAGDVIKHHIKDPAYRTEAEFVVPRANNEVMGRLILFDTYDTGFPVFSVTALRASGTGTITARTGSVLNIFRILP